MKLNGDRHLSRQWYFTAVMYQAAEQSIRTLQDELTLAAEAGIPVETDTVLAEVNKARDEVTTASKQLELAISAAAQAGQADEFDQVLEDVVRAALRHLMS